MEQGEARVTHVSAFIEIVPSVHVMVQISAIRFDLGNQSCDTSYMAMVIQQSCIYFTNFSQLVLLAHFCILTVYTSINSELCQVLTYLHT